MISAPGGQSAGGGTSDGTAGGSAGKAEEPHSAMCAHSVGLTFKYISAAGRPGDSSSADSAGDFHDSVRT